MSNKSQLESTGAIDLSLVDLTTAEPKEGEDGKEYAICKTYKVNEFPHNDFFKNNGADGLELWAPTKGASSKSTHRTRNELREVSAKSAVNNWSYGDAAHHFLQATLTVKQVPKHSNETVVGQIHVDNSTRPPLKLSWDNSKIVLGLREDFNQKDPVDTVLLEGVPLNAKWSYSIHVTRTGMIATQIKYDGKTYNNTFALKPTWADAKLYFKAGVYNQEDPVETTGPDEGSRAQFHAFSIRHGDA